MQRLRTLAIVIGLAAPLAGCGRDASSTPERESSATPSGTRADPESAPSPECSVEVEGPTSAAVGEQAKATVTLRPHGRFEVNQDAPLSVRVRSSSLALEKERYGVDDATVLAPDEVALEIPFSAAAPGTHTLEVHAHFGLCGGDACALCRKAAELSTVVN
ncbi:MAG: hypothetical protein D6705_12365 [Deltaproteobacteria bacterium]|nr:MAG: hypothetical protein D6705_12365 [Deltaproteobacteria bacterium]